MKRLFYLILVLLVIPVVVNAKTVTCTTTGNFVEGKNVYDSITVKCDNGAKINPFAICEVGSSIYDEEIGASSCNVKDPYKAKAGKKYALSFEIVLQGVTSGDKIVVDGDSSWSIVANFGCYEDYGDGYIGGCTVSSKEYTAKAASGQTPTTTDEPKKDDPVTVNVYWVRFDVNGGKEEIKQRAVEEGKTATKPADPTRDGYKFKEWQLDGKTYDFSTKIKKSIKLKAVWEEDTTGKKNISFVNLTGLLAPYEGELLDTDVRVETYKAWTKDIFSVDLKWYRGKDINKIDELVLTARDPKVEEGYYYQAKFTLTPGKGYTLNGTNVSLNKKLVTTTKNEASLVFTSEVYGPIEKGVSAEPIIVIPDVIEHIASDEPWEDRDVYFEVRAHDSDGDDVVVDGKKCITLSDTEHFKLKNPICVGGKMNLTSSEFRQSNIWNSLGDLYLTEAASKPGTYTTTITLTDEKGRTYSGRITIVRGKNPLNPVSISSEDGSVWAEFAGEALSTWYVHAEELYNKDNGQRVKEDMRITDLGELVSVKNITVSNENGEKSNGAFTLKIKIDEELKKYKHFTFVYIYDAETYRMGAGPEKVEGVVEGDYLVVTLPHLSTYAIYGTNDESKASTKTKDSSNKNNIILYVGIGVGALVVIGAVVLVLSKKKKAQ